MDFDKRFGIKIGLVEAQQRFVNRVHNDIFYDLNLDDDERCDFARCVASDLGIRYEDENRIEDIVCSDFLMNLRALEIFYDIRKEFNEKNSANHVIENLLKRSEVDLGIEWRDGKFYRKGAESLDKILVNDELKWLRKAGYQSVLEPYEKGLGLFLTSRGKQETLSDVVTDMYEALEALARIKTGKDRDLSGNQELFVSKVKASDAYKTLLRDYIGYANNYRHAATENRPKPKLSEREVESFIYLTGVFIRLAMPE